MVDCMPKNNCNRKRGAFSDDDDDINKLNYRNNKKGSPANFPRAPNINR